MSPWDILGIASTTDEREIRRAYARVLKTIDQELEPEKFIALREALEAARHEAYYASLEQQENAEDNIFAETAGAENISPADNAFSQPAPLPEQPADNPFSDQPFAELTTEHQATTATTQAPELPLHQHGFEFLMEAIQQQNSQLDLRKELVDYVDYILSLPASVLPDVQAQFYLQQLDSACKDAGLNGINDFLNIRKPQAEAENHRQPTHATEPVATLKVQEQLFKDKLDQLCQALWNEHFNDENFALFQQCLNEWPEQSLEHQMATYDQLSYVLGSAQEQSEASNRFLLHWYEHFGNDVPPASAEAALHRLHDRIEALKKEEEYWQRVPAKNIKALRQLQRFTAFRPLDMLALYFRGYEPLPELQDAQHNPNVHYLNMATNIKKFWPCMVMVMVSHFMLGCFTPLIAQPYYLVGGLLLMAVIWISLIQAPILAYLVARPNREQLFNRLDSIWFGSALLLAFISPALPTLLLAGLLSAWTLLSTLVLGHALYSSDHSYEDSIRFSIRIEADKVFVCFATLALPASLAFLLCNTQLEQPMLSSIFMILPLSFIWVPDYFKAFFARIFKKPADFIVSLQTGKIALVILAGIIIKSLYTSGVFNQLSSNHYVAPLYALSLFFMFVLAFVPSSFIAFAAKYTAYFGIIAFCILKFEDFTIFSILISGLCGYYLYHTLREDLKLKKLIKEQHGNS